MLIKVHLVTIFLAISLSATEYKFRYLTPRDGLSQSTVEAIIQDQNGFIWLGTNDGLNRFNGYDLTDFRNDPNDSTSISDNYIYSFVEGPDSALWIGTNNGLNRFDYITETFRSFVKDSLKKNSLNNNFIHRLIFDNNGNLWIATVGGGLNFYDRKNKRFWVVANEQLADNRIISVHISPDNFLWFATYSGNVYRLKIDIFYEYYNPENKALSLPADFLKHIRKMPVSAEDIIWVIYTDKESQTWICTNRFGVFKYEENRDQLVSTDFLKLNDKSIHTMLQDKDGKYWFGTESGGVNIYNPDKDETIYLKKDDTIQGGLKDNGIWYLYEDRNYNIWVGTEFNGANIYNPDFNLFEHILLPVTKKNNNQVIWALIEDTKNNIWLGTEGRGLLKYDRVKKTFTSFKNNPADNNSISYNLISSLLILEDNLWIGTNGGGLNKLDLTKMSFERYLHNPDDPASLSNNIIKATISDDSGNIWIGTYGGGLEKLDTENKVFEHHNVGLNFISSLLFDKDGHLWIGSYGNGLVKYDHENGNFMTFKNKLADSLSLGNDRIQTIFQSDNGTIWVGTSAGFSKYNNENNTFINFGTADGLINNVVYAILEDDNGCLWMTTNHGVSRFNPQTRQFTNFTEKDGLQSYEFNRGAAFKNRNSELLIGGINGFNIFNPQKMTIGQNNSPVVLTAFYKWNEKVKTDSALFLKKQIQLAYNVLSFGFEFAALDYSLPPQTSYLYKMENFDVDWIESGERRFAYYTHLDPGEYTFKVKTADNNSNENIAQLKILIAPPFWQTWWFYLISLIILVFLIVLFIQIKVRQRVTRFIEIEKIKNIENERIRKKAAQDFHDGLGHKLAKISLLSQTVRTLFGSKIPEANEYFTKISDTSETLNNDMRNFLWMLNPDKDSLFEIALHLKDFGEDLFDKSGIAFRVKEIPRSLEKYSMDMDWKHNFLMLFREAMNNILKHSQCKTVNLNFELFDSQLKVILNDDGLGFQTDTKFKGHGLQNMKQRADTLKSSLDISSKNGSGTSIKFITRLD